MRGIVIYVLRGRAISGSLMGKTRESDKVSHNILRHNLILEIGNVLAVATAFILANIYS